ncbi:hypothetical protein ANO11243_096020 [Dothideomycetidae sp. 11243]|nr:hypothetical protein ANO11243_096020 [fungal sp. No.11243]
MCDAGSSASSPVDGFDVCYTRGCLAAYCTRLYQATSHAISVGHIGIVMLASILFRTALALCCLSCLVASVGPKPPWDLSHPIAPVGKLGVQLDRSLALNSGKGKPKAESDQDTRNVVLSTHLVFQSSVSSITDSQLMELATEAHGEMQKALSQYGFSNKYKPTAMTVLAVGNDLYFSSSEKGPTPFTCYEPKSLVTQQLDMCKILASPTGEDHMAEYSCGEIMSAFMYDRLRNGRALAGQDARVLTVARNGGAFVVRPPCSDAAPNKWGCKLFVQEHGLRAIDDVALKRSPYGPLASLAGGHVRTDQIQLC